MRETQHKLRVARGEEPAELVFTNANVVNVLSGEIHLTNVAVDDERVIGFGDYEAREIVDLKGAYLAPSFIEGHFHVESTMVTLPELVRAVVPHGTGAMVIDPHEYANVLGMDGIRYVLESSKNLPIDFFVMLPSCVPATEFETAGARFTADDLALLIADDRIAGIAELMNYPGVFLGLESELAKIDAGKGKVIDGHAPGLRGRNLNAYALAGVRSDHESIDIEGRTTANLDTNVVKVEAKGLPFDDLDAIGIHEGEWQLEVYARLGLHRLDLTEADHDCLLARVNNEDRRIERDQDDGEKA